MTPSARLQACIEILSAIGAGHLPDRAIHNWTKMHKFAGSGDRRAIGDTVHDILRHRGFLVWVMRGDSHPRALVISWAYHLKKIGREDLEHLFSDEKYAPNPLNEKERTALANPPSKADMPFEAKYNLPAWMEVPLTQSLGDDLENELSLLDERASLDLRVNTLKASLDTVIDGFERQCIEVYPTPYSPVGLRLDVPVSLKGNSLYEDGLIEVQDEGSQLASILFNPKPEESILDYCAGAGGKTLAIASLMENKGEIIASDISEKRLQSLKVRAERAGISIIRALNQTRLHPDKKQFDKVFVDSPCSGSGTWRRNSGARWALTAEQLEEFHNTQKQVLNDASRFVKTGGLLAYVTCSLFQRENEDVVQAFLADNSSFQLASVKDAWTAVLPNRTVPQRVDQTARFTTYHTGSDSFFMALFQKENN